MAVQAISHLIHRDYEAIVQDFVTLDFIPKGKQCFWTPSCMQSTWWPNCNRSPDLTPFCMCHRHRSLAHSAGAGKGV